MSKISSRISKDLGFPEYIKVGKKKYQKFSTFTKKTDANKYAEMWRKRRFNARVKPRQKKKKKYYVVYLGKKG